MVCSTCIVRTTFWPRHRWDEGPIVARFRPRCVVVKGFRRRTARRGGWGREGVRSEARAQQRLAPGGRSPHNPENDLAEISITWGVTQYHWDNERAPRFGQYQCGEAVSQAATLGGAVGDQLRARR